MSQLIWIDDFATGVASIDHEHRELIALINELCRSLEGTTGSARDELFGELFAKISAHFALEEHIMRDKKYDRYLEHKTDHEKLLDELRGVMDKQDGANPFSNEKLVSVMNTWFSVHFKTEDARLHHKLG